MAVSVFLFGVTAAAARGRVGATDRIGAADQREDEARDGTLDRDLAAARDAEAAAIDRADSLGALFTPEVLTATHEVQTGAADFGCTAARTAVRDGTDLPTGEDVAAFAVATAANDSLDVLPSEWGQMVDAEVVQAEIDRCAADETTLIETERRAAAAAQAAADAAAAPDLNTCDGFLAAVQNAGRPPSSGEVQYLYIECGIDIAGR